MPNDRIRTSIQADFRAGPVQGRGTIRNLSEGGLFLGTSQIPEQGETAELRFVAPGGRRVRVSGMVWWTTEGEVDPSRRRPGFGLRLLDDDNEAYQRLIEQLRR